MSPLAWLLLAVCIIIACMAYSAKRADLWGLKGVGIGSLVFAGLWWVLPILWGIAKAVAVVAILGALAGVGYLFFKAVAKHA